MAKLNRIHTETGIILEYDNVNEPDLKSHLVLIIAGSSKEFENYKITHDNKTDHLVYALNKEAILGCRADYIKIIGTAEERSDYLDLEDACIERLKSS